MNIVPRVVTTISEADAAAAILRAFPMPRKMNRQEAELYLAHIWAIEDARGNGVLNNNPGNLTAAESYVGDAYRPSWFELTDTSSEKDKARHADMLAGKAPSAFRSYPSFDQGLTDYFKFIFQKFVPLASAANSGDPVRFANAIFDTHYSAEEPAQGITRASTADSLRSLLAEFDRAGMFSQLQPVGAGPAPLVPGATPPRSQQVQAPGSHGPSPSALQLKSSDERSAGAGGAEFELRLCTDITSTIPPGGEVLFYVRMPRAATVLRVVVDHHALDCDPFPPYPLPAGAFFAVLARASKLLPAQQAAAALTLVARA